MAGEGFSRFDWPYFYLSLFFSPIQKKIKKWKEEKKNNMVKKSPLERRYVKCIRDYLLSHPYARLVIQACYFLESDDVFLFYSSFSPSSTKNIIII